jgi:hypothetical protein
VKRMILTAVAVAAVTAAATGVGTAAGTAGGKTPSGVTTLKLKSKVDRVSAVDNPPAGRSAGDVVVFTEKLFDARGKQVGTDAATCTALFDQRALCNGVYILAKGQVMVQLVQPGPTGTYSQAIVGGSGAYSGARGTVTVAQSAGGDRFTFRIRLR